MTPSEFDKFFRDNIRSNQPEFDPKAWEKAESMIVEAEKAGYFTEKSKVFPAAFISASLLIVFSLIPISLFKGGEYYSNYKKQKIEKTKADKQIVEAIQTTNHTQIKPALNDATIISKAFVENTPIAQAHVSNQKTLALNTTSANELLAGIPENSETLQLLINENVSPLPLLSSKIKSHDQLATQQLKREEKKYRFKPNTIFLLAGTNISNNQSQKTSSGSFSSLHLLGVGYSTHIKSSWGFNAALSFNARNPGLTAKTFETKEYGFGVETNATTIKPIAMQYISAPLQLTYSLKSGIQVSAGAEIAYLINVESEVSNISENNGEIIASNKNTEWGYTQAFNNIDIGIITGISQSLNEKLKVGANLYYGLTDITNNDYFNSDKVDRSMQFRLYINYNIIRF
jgi:hypothetical protein